MKTIVGTRHHVTGLLAALPDTAAAVVRVVPAVEADIATANAAAHAVLLAEIDLTVKEATLQIVEVDAVEVTTMIHLPEATVIEITPHLREEATTTEDRLLRLATTGIEDLP